MYICVYVYMSIKKKPQNEPGDDSRLTPAFRAMADGTRLKILLMLESQPRTVGEIVSFFHLSQPTITRHLQTLTAAGLVRRKRQGQHVAYELDADNLRSICVGLTACFPCCCITVSSEGQAVACSTPAKDGKAKRPVSGAGRSRISSGISKSKGGKR
jgi:DNA-binding transcriptional ArsR family regulator